MHSDTLVASSPIKIGSISSDYDKPPLSRQEHYKAAVRNTLNPNLRMAHSVRFALPLTWKEITLSLAHSNNETTKQQIACLEEYKSTLFPRRSKKHTTCNINIIARRNAYDDFMLWFTLFQLPRVVIDTPNKIQAITHALYDYLTAQNIHTLPFMLVTCPTPVSLLRIRSVHSMIRRKMKTRPSNPKPLLTIHIHDSNSPYIMLWMDTENLCSFNLTRLHTPARIAFANSIVHFLNIATE